MAKRFIEGLAVRKRQGGHFNYALFSNVQWIKSTARNLPPLHAAGLSQTTYRKMKRDLFCYSLLVSDGCSKLFYFLIFKTKISKNHDELQPREHNWSFSPVVLRSTCFANKIL